MQIWPCKYVYIHIWYIYMIRLIDFMAHVFLVNIPKTLMRNGSILQSVYTIVYTGCIFAPKIVEHATIQDGMSKLA